MDLGRELDLMILMGPFQREYSMILCECNQNAEIPLTYLAGSAAVLA